MNRFLTTDMQYLYCICN